MASSTKFRKISAGEVQKIFGPLEHWSVTGFCPHCGKEAQMRWSNMNDGKTLKKPSALRGTFGVCYHCEEATYWNVDQELVWPPIGRTHEPHPSMPPDIARDFIEAGDVAVKSPRSAAALLRLAVQKLCYNLGAKPNSTIDDAIGTLKAKGLAPNLVKALDILRIVGNEQVHPGQLDVRDNPQMVNSLFKFLNLVVEQTISQENEINEFYSLLPANKIAGIEQRDVRKAKELGQEPEAGV